MNIITTEENIKLAYRNLKKNAGSKTPGTDGKTIAELAKMSEAELIQVVQRKFDWYQPQAVRRKEIPKGNGEMRPLGIPTIMDRLIQQCVLQVMEPICEENSVRRAMASVQIAALKMLWLRPKSICRKAICTLL